MISQSSRLLIMYFPQQLKSKWKEMKRLTKQKVTNNKREMAKTGGGVAKIMELSTVDRLVETTIGKASLHGVGGMDTLKGLYEKLHHKFTF